MEEVFDPYRKWLGIPPEEQPPNHYRLLGIALYEHDLDVISNAADRQMAHVRTFQTGQRAPLSQKLLNELSAAKICLLNPESKQQYDAKLLALHAQLPRAVAVPIGSPLPPGRPANDVGPSVPSAIPVAASNDVIADNALPTIRTAKRRPKIALPESPQPKAVTAASANANRSAPIAIADAPLPVTVRGTSPRVVRRSSSSAAIGGIVAVGLLVLLVVFVAAFLGGDGAPTGESEKDRPSAKEKPKSSAAPPKQPASATVPLVNAPTNEKPPLVPKEVRPPDKGQTNSGDKRHENPADGRADDKPKPSDPGTPAPMPPEAPTPPSDEPTPAAPTKRPPPPAPEAITKAYRILRKELEPQLRSAVAPEERFDLVQQIVERAGGETESAAQYALYMLAHNLGVQLASADTACDIIDLLAARYDVDAFEMKRSAIDQIAQFVTLGVEDYEHLLRLLQRFARDAMAAEKSDAAVALSRLAKATSLKVRTPKALKEFPALEDLLADVDRLAAETAEFDREVKAFDRNARQLAKEPDDAAANLGAGRYWLLVKGDWQRALPHLSKGADPTLKDPATVDLAEPKTPAEQAALADAWAALVPRKGGLFAPRLLDRAKFWYARAFQSAADAEKPAIKTKLAAVEAQLKALRPPENPSADENSSTKEVEGPAAPPENPAASDDGRAFPE